MSSNPPRTPWPLRPRALILLPYNDLLIDQSIDQPFDIIPSFQLGLVLPYGMGPSEPKVFQMDASGALKVALPPAGSLSTVIVDGIRGSSLSSGQNLGGANTNKFMTFGFLSPDPSSNANWDGAAEASALNLAAQRGLGVGLVSGPGEWSVSSNPAAGTAASASRVAGGAGIRHVCQSILLLLSASTALGAANTVTVNLRDGATGAGTILESYQVTLAAAVIPPVAVVITDINVVGSAATAMTAEGSAGIGNLMESVTLRGYDAS